MPHFRWVLAIIVAGLTCAANAASFAADRAAVLPAHAEATLNYTVSWVGNTFAEPNKWVQMDAAAMFVANDGTVYLNVFWEEGGRWLGPLRYAPATLHNPVPEARLRRHASAT